MAQEAYCFRCKTKKLVKDPTESRMRNGKACMTGTCVTCGTKLFKILPSLSVVASEIPPLPPIPKA